jgi:hypothetical protein
MRVVVAHHSTQQAAMGALDGASDGLLGAGIKNILIVDQQKIWDGPVMKFSFTGKLGFISIPLAGTVAVDDTNVTLECELPPLVKNLLGEETFRVMMEDNVRAMVQPAR